MVAFLISHFSAQTPKKGPKIPAGAIRDHATKLVQNVDSVKFHASQPILTFCIHRPSNDRELQTK